jgi:D-psicose/D-tagatose/L-ribulose 3-epimerase
VIAIQGRQLSCSTIAFRQYSLNAALQAIAELGFEQADIGVMGGYCPHYNAFTAGRNEELEFIRTIAASGLKVRTFTATIGNFNDPSGDIESFLKAARHTLAVAAAVGASGVNVNNGLYRDRTAYPLIDDIHTVGKYLRIVAEEAGQSGLVLLIEAPHKGNLIRNADEAVLLAETINHENIKLVFDTNHHHASGWGIADAARTAGRKIGLVHLRDAVGRSNAYPLGSGEIDFVGMFNILQETGYSGDYSLEFTDAGRTVDEIKQVIQESVSYLETLNDRA